MNEIYSALLSRDYKFFEAARLAALKSDFSTKVGAVAVYGRKIIASAASSQKTSPLQCKYNVFRNFQVNGANCLPKVHAEISLIAKLKKMDGIDYKRVSVYVYRICKSRRYALAYPCPACHRALKDLGIRNLYYTTDSGLGYEWIDCEEA